MSEKKTRHAVTIALTAVLMFFVSGDFPPPAAGKHLSFPQSKLDKILKDFTATESPTAVCILQADTGKVEYIYNRPLAVGKKLPPGSLAKVWTAALLLEEPHPLHFDIRERVICKGKFFPKQKSFFSRGDDRTFNLVFDQGRGKKYFRCALRDGHGLVDFRTALSSSCNVYFLTMASKRPHYFYRRLVNKWHLDRGTGARLRGGLEYSAALPKNISAFQAAASAVGEGGTIRVTPLKVAQTFCALFAATPLLVPFEGRGKPRHQYNLNLSPRTRTIIIGALNRVLHQGTLKNLKNKNIRVKLIGGKTGTATHYRKKYATHGWNVICFKYKHKKYVMTLFVHRGSGAREARRLSQEIINAL